MRRLKHRKVVRVLGIIIGILIAFVVIELLIVKLNGKPVDVPQNIPRMQTFGSGPSLNYVVFGDSTTVSQGGDYAQGFAVQSARLIANKGYTVHLHNYGVSGARAHDVYTKQLTEMTETPDTVLIAVGSNDVVHLSNISSVKNSVSQTIDTLRQRNPDVQIIITGAGAMGTTLRFPQPLRWIAGQRTNQMNTMFSELSKDKAVINAEVAKKLEAAFTNNPKLSAPDKFHPNTEGYKLWTEVINEAIDQTL